MSAASDVPHIVYFFDEGFAPCTFVSIHSILRHMLGGVRISLHPTFRHAALTDKVNAFSAAFPNAELQIVDVDLSAWQHVRKGRLPLSALSRLLLPQLHSGRVIYLDGDVIARRDPSALWQADLEGKCIGACVAPGVQVRLELIENASPLVNREPGRKTLARGERLHGIDMRRYFNSGVMVLDLDRIHAEGLVENMSNVAAAAECRSLDQDWLNMVFRDQTCLLDPTWNSGWGNARTAKSYVNPTLREHFRESREDPAIIHFSGSEKPWHSARPPFRAGILTKPYERRQRARFWSEYQAERAATDAALSLPQSPP